MQTPHEMRTRIIDRAVNDADYRAKLLGNPRAAVGDELGVAMPDKLAIHVHEESPTDAHIVLPPSSDLSAEELHNAAGGEAWKVAFPSTW